jgi:hypothetical protein
VTRYEECLAFYRDAWAGCPSSSGRTRPANQQGQLPAGHPVKGTWGSRSTTSWIHHPPGSGSYAATDPEECFATTADAEAAGYRAARN